MRIGFGYDVHALVEGRPLVIGGIEIPHQKGSAGHSDADVLIHAIIDALLGAAGLRDIGHHFPDTDSRFKNIDSKHLLTDTISMLQNNGFEIGNIDTTVCLEKPVIEGFIPKMQAVLCDVMQIAPDKLSIKAKTNEKLGFVGNEEGVTAYAVALIY
jgi:2-C-methyl-D-erythritol 2,4-cyclodiphosphate synthase